MGAWVFLLATSFASTPSCDPNPSVQAALAAVLAEDPLAAEAALSQSVEAWGCGAVADRQTLSRFWLVDAAVAQLRDDPVSAADGFGAAKALAPNVWLPELPDALLAAYRAAPVIEGRGALLFDPPLGIREVWVDGAQVVGPAEIEAGAHLVQVGDGAGGAAFASTVFVSPALSVRVLTGLPSIVAPPLPPPPPEPPPTPPPRRQRLVVQLLTGADLATGQSVTVGTVEEPALRVAIPFELAAGIRTERWLGRLHVGTGWLANGDYAAQSRVGGAFVTAWRADVAVSGAVVTKPLHIGLLAGAQWPGRLAVRGVLGSARLEPLVLELRGGVNAVTDRPIEPSVSVLVGVEVR